MAREASAPMRPFAVAALDGRVAASVVATAAPAVQSENADDGGPYTEIKAPIGTEEPIVCWVYPERRDAGQFVRGVLAHAKGNVELPAVDVTTHDDGPIVFVEAPVHVDGGKTFAFVKLAIAPRDEGSIACMHDEVGYKKTFRIFVKGLVASEAIKTHEPAAKLVEVSVWREDGRVAGFVERRLKVKGDERLETFFGAAVLKHGAAWAILDAAGGTATTLDGKLLRSDTALVLDGAMVTRMHVEKTGEGQFAYSGSSKGKKIEGTLKARQTLTTELAVAPKLKALAAGKVAEVRYTTFDDDTGALSDVLFKRDKAGVTKTTGPASKPQKRAVLLDDAGLVKGESDASNASERLLLRGAP